ncbi:FIG00554998: hypothetical protein [Cronobacter sakazakii 701]|nr:FIG00554998: hypothetical protein [Cronobacter sakazakii 701]
MVIHKAAHETGDFRAGFQALGHFRATQVEIAVFQTRFFAVDLVGVERQRLGAVDDGQFGGEHFYFAGRHIAVDVFLVARTHGPGDLNAELITQFRGEAEGVGAIRVEKHLNDAFTIAHVDKNQTAEIATTVDPTTQSHLLSDVGQIELPAIFCTHEISLNLAAGRLSPALQAPLSQLWLNVTTG